LKERVVFLGEVEVELFLLETSVEKDADTAVLVHFALEVNDELLFCLYFSLVLLYELGILLQCWLKLGLELMQAFLQLCLLLVQAFVDLLKRSLLLQLL